MIIVRAYKTKSGNSPFRRWIRGLDRVARRRVSKEISKLKDGHRGNNVKSLGGGLYEIRLTIGGGLRIYWTEYGGNVIILLAGGDKSRQSADIKAARERRADYIARQRGR